MRISDWSSDVCSSDLDHLMTADAVGVPGAAGVLQFQARAVGQVAQESEVGVAVAAEDLVAEALGALHHGGAEGEGAPRTEARRVGKDRGRPCRSRWARFQKTKSTG